MALAFIPQFAGAAADPPPVAAAPTTDAAPYISAFESYRAFRDDPMVSWRDANQKIGALGGHMGHVRGSTGMGTRTGESGTSTPRPR